MQRLDIKSVRYDRFGKAVLINGRKVVLEISQEALEVWKRRKLSEEEAIHSVVEEAKKLTMLAERVPADDGKIHITANILMNDGIFGVENGG